MTDSIRPQALQTDFERFALDHAQHTHCQGCGGCILDPSHFIQGYPCWCIVCRDRIKANAVKNGTPVPWKGQWELA